MKRNPRIVCNDGVSLSVQGSEYAYCSPRINEGPYLSVEVGYITDADKNTFTPPLSWRRYADGEEFPNAVYGYVPFELVEAFIADHGGAKEGAMPQ